MSNMNKKFIMFGITLTFGLLVGALGVLWQKPSTALGSIETGQGYYATTTGASAAATTLKNGYGQFGSVVITKTDVGTMAFYDATTSDVNKRTNNAATSTLLLGFFPASPTVGLYTFDTTVANGLLMVYTASPASTTVTWK